MARPHRYACCPLRLVLVNIVILLSLILLPGLPPNIVRAGARSEGSSAQPSSRLAADDDLILVYDDTSEMVFELRPPAYTVTEGTDGAGVRCQTIEIGGYGTPAMPGAPLLPVRGALVGIPEGVRVSLSIVEVTSVDLLGVYNICPVSRVIMDTDLEGRVVGRQVRAERDADIFGHDTFWPTQVAELGEVGYLRDEHVAQLTINPLQLNPVTGRLRQLTRIVVRLSFELAAAPGELRSTGPRQPLQADDPFEPLYRQSIANWSPSHGAAESGITGPAQAVSLEMAPDSVQPRVKLLVSEDGLYRVTYADLAEAGIDVAALDPRTLALTYRGQPVAIRVAGEQDRVFDPGDALVFYGQGIDSPYTAQNVYYLFWGVGSPLRMAGRDASPDGTAPIATHYVATQHVERDLAYQPGLPSGIDQDRWYWNYIYASGAPAMQTYPFDVPILSGDPVSVTLHALLRSFSASSGEHRCDVSLNGVFVADATWPINTDFSLQATAPLDAIREGTNSIGVTCGVGLLPGQTDVVFVNRFDVSYPRPYMATDDLLSFNAQQTGLQEIRATGFSTPYIDVYDISAPLLPVQVSATVTLQDTAYTVALQTTIVDAEQRYVALTESEYRAVDGLELVVPRDLQSASNGADYVVVSHGDFLDAVQPLAQLRRSQGLRVEVVDVQDIYDVFGYGIVDPLAIRDFLVYTYSSWTRPAPAYVLLVGDGNYDPKDNLRRGETSYVPPYLASVDPWMGETAADNRYVAVNGSDIFPDMFLGRLPAKSTVDAEAMVAKILAYENALPGDWQAAVTFVADNPDAAGDFRAYSSAIADGYLPAPYTAERIYYGIDPYATIPAARAAIHGAFNNGRLLINYAGHSSVQAWASELLLKTDQLSSLSNSLLPFMAPMTCLEGYYVNPPGTTGTDLSSLSETLVRIPGKGAIASFAPSGLGVATGHHFLQEGLFTALFQDGITELGAATTAAKLNLYANTAGYRELIDTYLLMGDPALKLKVLEADVSLQKTVSPAGNLLPGDPITYTLTYANAGPATAFNVEISDPLPAGIINPVVSSSGPAIALRPGSNLIWDIFRLEPGASGMITVTATVSTTFGGDLTNAATISTTVPESNETNNAPPAVETWVQPADVYITKSVLPVGPLRPGDPITYKLSYGNSGEIPAPGVVITDLLPLGLTDVQVASSGPAIVPRDGTAYVWDVEDLVVGASGLITVTATVADGYFGYVDNVATIATSTGEADTTNNTSQTRTLVPYKLYLPIVLR